MRPRQTFCGAGALRLDGGDDGEAVEAGFAFEGVDEGGSASAILNSPSVWMAARRTEFAGSRQTTMSSMTVFFFGAGFLRGFFEVVIEQGQQQRE